MTNLMIILGSVRPGRVGLPIAQWVRGFAEADDRFAVDFVDLVQLGLPFLDEPGHPGKREYTKPHTIAWSERVAAADAVILVSPEYNHSYSPALKNAIDFLFHEWSHKPVAFVSYGGVSSGSRAAAALDPVLVTVGLVKVASNVEISLNSQRPVDGVFQGDEKVTAILGRALNELDRLAEVLRPLR